MSYIPEHLRQQVIERANNCCEYCLLPLDDDYVRPEVDHIIAIKHRGATTEENLCLSCIDCNRHKGSDLGSIDSVTHDFAFLYNPRHDRWAEHFRLQDEAIEPLTPQGRVTVFLLRMNEPLRVLERTALIKINRYPCRPHEL